MTDYNNQSFNIFKSLSSVHLPPPPSPKSYPAAIEEHYDQNHHNHHHVHHQRHPSNDSNTIFFAPGANANVNSNAFKYRKSNNINSGIALTDISNPVLNTPPPTQSRNSVVGNPKMTPTLGHSRKSGSTSFIDPNKENMYSHMLSPAGSSPLASSIPDKKPAAKPGQDKRRYLSELPAPQDLPPIEDDGSKPPYSYATLIGMAILRSPHRKLTLSQIYQWINDTFLWYRQCKSGWQNSIRHNLSLNKAFKKQERPKGDPGKGNYWLVEEGYEYLFLDLKSNRRSSQVTFHGATASTASASSVATAMSRNSSSSTTDEEIVGTISSAAATATTFKQFQQCIDEEDQNTPLKRCNSAIGLQRFEMKRTFNNTNNANDNEEEDQEQPQRKKFASNNNNKKRINSLGRNLDAGEVPLLAPMAWNDNWSQPDATSNTSNNNFQFTMPPLESPKRFISGNLILGPNKPNLCPPPSLVSQPPSKMASPNTSIRNHRAAIRNMTASPELDDLFNTNQSPIRQPPQPQPSQLQQQRAQDDDAVSRLIFGSPNKQQRRQYYEQTGLFDNNDTSATDMFGVDLYQLCQREIERGPSSSSLSSASQPSSLPSHHQPQQHQQQVHGTPVRLTYDFMRFDSPIKNQIQTLSPPKITRKKSTSHNL